jgi:hypothetical protein
MHTPLAVENGARRLFGTMVTMRATGLLLCTLLTVSGGLAFAQAQVPQRPAPGPVGPCPELGYFRNCYGTYTWYDGSTYEGAWKDNQKTGIATYKDANGDSYVGEWKSNRRSGEGIYSWSDGRVWMGEWKEGEPHGKFIQYAPDKSVERMGIFQKGRLLASKLVEPSMFTRIRRYIDPPAAANLVPNTEPPTAIQAAGAPSPSLGSVATLASSASPLPAPSYPASSNAGSLVFSAGTGARTAVLAEPRGREPSIEDLYPAP